MGEKKQSLKHFYSQEPTHPSLHLQTITCLPQFCISCCYHRDAPWCHVWWCCSSHVEESSNIAKIMINCFRNFLQLALRSHCWEIRFLSALDWHCPHKWVMHWLGNRHHLLLAFQLCKCIKIHVGLVLFGFLPFGKVIFLFCFVFPATTPLPKHHCRLKLHLFKFI